MTCCPICLFKITESNSYSGLFDCIVNSTSINKPLSHNFRAYLDEQTHKITEYYLDVVYNGKLYIVSSYFSDNISIIEINNDNYSFPFVDSCEILESISKLEKMKMFL